MASIDPKALDQFARLLNMIRSGYEDLNIVPATKHKLVRLLQIRENAKALAAAADMSITHMIFKCDD